jgi:hypothetical protein
VADVTRIFLGKVLEEKSLDKRGPGDTMTEFSREFQLDHSG